MARHGVSGFMRLRMLRLGVPWVLFTVLVWPLFMWFAYRAAGHPLSYWQEFRGRTPFLDSGPLWCVQALAFDVVEASLVVAGSVWLLALAQRRLTSRAPLLAASARAA